VYNRALKPFSPENEPQVPTMQSVKNVALGKSVRLVISKNSDDLFVGQLQKILNNTWKKVPSEPLTWPTAEEVEAYYLDLYKKGRIR
jgi:hypothetical protein